MADIADCDIDEISPETGKNWLNQPRKWMIAYYPLKIGQDKICLPNVKIILCVNLTNN